jgi:pimeloyl-ACP methyl ester carboxylesterase
MTSIVNYSGISRHIDEGGKQMSGKLVWAMLVLLSVTIAPLAAQESPALDGQMVDVGGYQLFLSCAGEGSPTVIMEPGFARSSLNAYALQQQIAEFTRVCAYDHAGYGRSESGKTPRTTQQIVTELESLLKNASVPAPYLLVAHSYGGFASRLFASRNADRMAGLVLADTTPPEFLQITTEDDNRLTQILQAVLQVAQASAWNQQTEAPLLTLINDVPDDLRPVYLERAKRPTFIQAALDEWTVRMESAEQVMAVRALGDVPLVVLVAAKRLELANERDIRWVQLQAQMATLSTRSQLIAPVGSDHEIFVERPDAVLDAIQWIIELAA